MDTRTTALTQWLAEVVGIPDVKLKPLAGDASFRRYYRLQQADGASCIAVDAPPERENCLAFIAIANGLRDHGLQTPEILADDIHQGFLLISDFGDQLLLKTLNAENATPLYQNALQQLARLQSCRSTPGWTVPPFTYHFMRQELNLFKEWFLEKYLRLSLSLHDNTALFSIFDFLAQTSANQPYVFMHRDYHAGNLMVLPDQTIGILDFQDAFHGPVTYDVVSLLRDCYIDWPDDKVHALLNFYYQQLNFSASFAEFEYWFDVMGMQRHLKALLTFARKFCRDRNQNYLQFMPRTLNYLEKISARHPETQSLHEFLVNIVHPAFYAKADLCAR